MHEVRSPILTGRFCSLAVIPYSSLNCCGMMCSEVLRVKSLVAVGEAVLELDAGMFVGGDLDDTSSSDVEDLVSSLVLLFDCA